MKEKYLSIGSVVRLKDGKKNLMIIGFLVSSPEFEGKTFDYNGCLYPEGVLSSDMNFLFNHDQIEEILYNGFENEEETIFKKRLIEFTVNGTIDGQVPNSTYQSSSSMNQTLNQNVFQPQMFINDTNQQ